MIGEFTQRNKLKVIKNYLLLQKDDKPQSVFQLIYQVIKKRLAFISVVCIPWLLMVFYLGILKTPQYESTASLLLDERITSLPTNGLQRIFSKKEQKNNKSDVASIFLIQNYIHSSGLLSSLQISADIKNHYQSNQVDFFSRLKKNPSQTDFLQYYRKKVTVSVDQITHQLTVSVRAFSPEKANELLTLILKEATDFFNKVSNANLAKQSLLMQQQLNRSKEKLIQAQIAFNEFTKNNTGQNIRVEDVRETKKLELKFAQTEYEMAQQAFVLWTMSSKKNTLIQTASPSLSDHYDYPKIPYDFISIFVVLLAAYFVGKMVLIVVREHVA